MSSRHEDTSSQTEDGMYFEDRSIRRREGTRGYPAIQRQTRHDDSPPNTTKARSKVALHYTGIQGHLLPQHDYYSFLPRLLGRFKNYIHTRKNGCSVHMVDYEVSELTEKIILPEL